MLPIYFGVIEYKDNKTNRIEKMMTGNSDSPIMAAILVEKEKLNEKISILQSNIVSALLDEEYLEIFDKENNLNFLAKNKMVPFLITFIEEIPYFESLIFIKDYEKKSPDEITEECKLNNPEIDIVFFSKFHESKYFKQEIKNFQNSNEFNKYKNKIKDFIKIEISQNNTTLEDESVQKDKTPTRDFVFKMNEAFIKNIVGNKWNKQISLFYNLRKRENLSLTIFNSQSENVSDFGEDNKEHILSFIKEEIKNAKSSKKLDELYFIVIIKQFANILNKNDFPEKIAVCILNEDGIYPISKKQALYANLTIVKSGEKNKKEKNLNYVEFSDLVEDFDVEIEPANI